ncbi:hypothetical protein EV356DRAFT_455885 [Viridothelium virens]|uniref:Aminoglycoside phosphotransferase domain-containing protein n=1 Tax=Viridothelium virens TaxID=1048519 RepID=A0A6A6GV06_VIRVR|nr:hypothetical protein EV356DRAFT_455885 [Viridothelium virens]
MSLTRPNTHPAIATPNSSNSHSNLINSHLHSFFTRNNLNPLDRDQCDIAATRLHPDAVIRVFEHQGYCSYTLYASFFSWSATHTSLLQFRPKQFAIDVELVAKARLIYGACVPRVWRPGTVKNPNAKAQHLEKRQLLIYEMDLLPGHPYPLLQPHTKSLSPDAYHRQLRLVRDLAAFLARGYHAANTTTTTPASSPASTPQMTGKVGPHLTFKLSRLAHDLPTPRLRAHAQRALSRLHLLRALPLVLNHGDLVPTNVLVDRATFELRGVVDWAEAEVLPWGVCAYGVEYALGWLASSSSARGSMVGREWVYYDCAASLRRSFWDALAEEVPALREEGGEMGEAVRLARDVGVLLWYGYAWDEGLIDRVVNWERDEVECVCLEAFLGVDEEERKDGIEAKL